MDCVQVRRDVQGSQYGRHEKIIACYSLADIMNHALKFGVVTLGLGLLCWVIQYAVYGGLGPCARPGQLETLLLGIGFTGIGGLVSLVSLPVVLVKKYKTRTSSELSLFDETHHRP